MNQGVYEASLLLPAPYRGGGALEWWWTPGLVWLGTSVLLLESSSPLPAQTSTLLSLSLPYSPCGTALASIPQLPSLLASHDFFPTGSHLMGERFLFIFSHVDGTISRNVCARKMPSTVL